MDSANGGTMVEGNSYEAAVRILIRLLHDGEKGFSDMGGKMKDPKHRAFYLEEADVRGAFAAELERALRGAIGAEVREDGTVLGPVHRAWLDTKAALGASDCKLLDSTEMCERLALRTYGKTLEGSRMPEALRGIVAHQAEHIRRTYRLLLLFRDEARG